MTPTNTLDSKSPSRPIFHLLLPLVPVALTFGLLLLELRGIPMFDDFQALIYYSVHFQRLHGIGPKLLFAFAAQHDEYKLIFEHLLVGLQLGLSPHIHYKFLALLGNLFVLGSAWVYFIGSFHEVSMRRRLLLFAPISFFLVQLNYVETLDWAMCGLQMIPVVFFSLLAFYLLTRPNSRGRLFVWACISATLACLASANGFILGLVGLLYLLQQRAWKRSLAWFAPFVAALCPYLYQYHAITRDAIVFPTPVQKLLFFLSYLGSAVENMHHFPIRNGSVILGLVLLVTWLYSLKVGYHRADPFAFYTALWVLICAAGVTQVMSKLGLDLSLTSRYKLYSDMLLIFVYVFAMYRVAHSAVPVTATRRLNTFGIALAFAILLNFSSAWFGYKFLKHRADVCDRAFRDFQADPQHNSPEVSLTDQPITTGEPEFSRKILIEAIADGVFLPPQNP